jgi:hypothetical protein
VEPDIFWRGVLEGQVERRRALAKDGRESIEEDLVGHVEGIEVDDLAEHVELLRVVLNVGAEGLLGFVVERRPRLKIIAVVVSLVEDDQDRHGTDRPVNAARPEVDGYPLFDGDALAAEIRGRVRPAVEDGGGLPGRGPIGWLR